MGKKTGFLEYSRQDDPQRHPLTRLKDYDVFHLSLDEAQRRRQGARCMNCGVPFCLSAIKIKGRVTGCPLHNLIPEWNDEIYRGQDRNALERLLKTNPFPEWTGRVCPALCEKACLCGLNGEAVTIRDNERFIIETAFAKGYMQPQVPAVRSSKRVAVIGSGPAGLSVAYALNACGHQVTVYEQEKRAGGLLRYGIPEMKLAKNIIDRRLEIMKAEGIQIMTGTKVGRDISQSELDAAYDAIVFCCGARKARQVAGVDLAVSGVMMAVDFLTAAMHDLEENKCPVQAKNKRVIVVGGGDTGNDCVAMCLRMGAKQVTQLEMMPRPSNQTKTPWPEWPVGEKVDYGQQEYRSLYHHDPRLYETTIEKLVVEERMLKGAYLVRGNLINGQWQVKAGSEQFLEADLILIAAGFVGVEDSLAEQFALPLSRHHTLLTNEAHYQIVQSHYFAAGDCHRGQSLVVWAIAEGLACAKEVDNYLKNKK